MVSVRAVYHNGQLHLLEPVALQDGQEVQVQIVDTTGELIDVIADLLVKYEETSDVADDGEDDEAVQRQLDNALAGKRPLSEIIIEERHEEA